MGGSFSATNLSGNHYHQIIPNLYIGDKYSIYEPFFVDKKLLVVNATNDVNFNKKLKSVNVRIPVDDDLSSYSNRVLFKNLHKITEIIHKYLNNNFIVLVHCVAGRQRSCATVAAYLMKYGISPEIRNMGMDSAIKHVKKKRPYAFFLNVNFKHSLKKFSDTLY